MLFKRKKKTDATPKPDLILSVPYSESFRGFKRIKLDSQDQYADAGIKMFKSLPTVDRISFEFYTFGEYQMIRVLADGNRLGTIWKSNDWYETIKSGKVERASIVFSQLDDVYLMVKLR